MTPVGFRSFLVGTGALAFALILIFTMVPLLGEPFQPSMFICAVIGCYSIGSPVAWYCFRQADELKAALTQMEKLHAELAEAHARLGERADRDAMTGLFNREAFLRLSQERTRNGAHGALLLVDIDHFKRINDTFGHLAGDDALIAVAQTLREAVGDGGLCGRIGGEEFGVLLASADEAERVAQEIRSAVEAIGFHPAAGIRQPLTVSIGGVAGRAGAVVTDLFRNADRHLYEAKDQGRNRVVFRAAA